MDRLTHSDCLAPILIDAGFWLQNPDQADDEEDPPTWSCLDVCREWRDCMLDHPSHMADLLRAVHGPEEALVRAAGCTSKRVDRIALLQAALKTARADCWDGEPLVRAAGSGHEDAVRLLLEWRENAPRADCQDGEALISAAAYGEESLVRLLLEWREHAPRADCRQGLALICAARHGHTPIIRLLLEGKEHAPRADCQNGQALIDAAKGGHAAVVRLLLEQKEHARGPTAGMVMHWLKHQRMDMNPWSGCFFRAIMRHWQIAKMVRPWIGLLGTAMTLWYGCCWSAGSMHLGKIYVVGGLKLFTGQL